MCAVFDPLAGVVANLASKPVRLDAVAVFHGDIKDGIDDESSSGLRPAEECEIKRQPNRSTLFVRLLTIFPTHVDRDPTGKSRECFFRQALS